MSQKAKVESKNIMGEIFISQIQFFKKLQVDGYIFNGTMKDYEELIHFIEEHKKIIINVVVFYF